MRLSISRGENLKTADGIDRPRSVTIEEEAMPGIVFLTRDRSFGYVAAYKETCSSINDDRFGAYIRVITIIIITIV